MDIPLAELIIRGLAIGAIYGLIALSISVVYSATNVFNFGHGDLVILGGMLAVAFLTWAGLPLAAAALLAILALAAVGVVEERIVMPPVKRHRSTITWLLTTLGVGIVIRSLLQIQAGNAPYRLPSIFPERVFTFVGTAVPSTQVIMFVGALLATLALEVFLRITVWGRAMRAVAQDPDAASLRGVNVGTVERLAWAIGAGLAALAGVLMAPITLLQAYFGLQFVLKGFIAVAVGGVGNNIGALIGGFALGLAEVFGTYWLGAAYRDTLAFVLLILILLVRPQGFLGQRVPRDV